MTMAKNMGPRRYSKGAGTTMPWAGDVRVIKPDGTVEIQPSIRYSRRRELAGHGRGRVSHKLKVRILERDKVCQNCGMANGPFHVDHIRPYSKGGWNVESNLQLLCAPCNQRKGAKWSRKSSG